MYASYLQQREDVSGPKCFFCRHPLQLDAKDKQTLDRDEDLDRLKRIEAGDPVAMREMGNGFVMKGDHTIALEYWTKAAGLGDVEAHYQLSIMYGQGRGVDKDKKKKCIIWRRRQLVVIILRGSILEKKNGLMVDLREQ